MRIGIDREYDAQTMLSVGGKLAATAVHVRNVNSWPDYVFHNEYKLLSLPDLQKYIKTYNHLPDVPNAETVAKDGVELLEMNALLLKKIEEMTLYLFQMNERLNKLEQVNTELRKK